MGQVGSVRACNGSQSLALSSEKALPLGHTHRGNVGLYNRNLFGWPLAGHHLSRFFERLSAMKTRKTDAVICVRLVKGVCFRCCIPASVFFLFLHFLAICCAATELKQETVEAFDRYIRATDGRMDAELRPGGPFLFLDLFPQPRHQPLSHLPHLAHLQIPQ